MTTVRVPNDLAHYLDEMPHIYADDIPGTAHPWDEVQQAGRSEWAWEPKDTPEDPYDDRPTPGALTDEEADDLERFHTRPRAFNPAAEWRARKANRLA